jgi:Transposase DDE domain
VFAFELFSRLPVGVAVLGHQASEHLGLRELLTGIGRNNLLILDRGYVGKALLRDMIASGNQVVLRMTTAEANSWECVYRFLRRKAKDAVIELTLPCRPGHEEEPLTVRVRLITRSFPRGRPGKHQGRETMVLLTTLTDAELAPREDLIALYSQRWGIETFNRELKTIYQVERFRSRTAERVEQELYACLTWLTIAAAAQSSADQAIRRKHGTQKWNDPTRIQVRRTYLFTIVTDWFQRLMAGTVKPEQLIDAISADLADLVRYAAKKRPGRSESRKRKHPNGRTSVK